MQLEKITNASQVSPRRSYDDACGTAHALDLIGERWALLVIRELMLGPKRFSDLKGDLPGISANVLTQRLESLEQNGILRRRRLPPPASTQVYELTEWGYEAEPIIQTMGRWAARSPAHDTTAQISATSILLSFRTMLNVERAEGFDALIGFRFGPESYLGTLRDGTLTYQRGSVAGAAAIFDGVPAGMAAAVYGGASFADLEAAGLLTVTGDLAVARRFATLFVLPPKFVTPPP